MKNDMLNLVMAFAFGFAMLHIVSVVSTEPATSPLAEAQVPEPPSPPSPVLEVAKGPIAPVQVNPRIPEGQHPSESDMMAEIIEEVSRDIPVSLIRQRTSPVDQPL